MKKIITWIRAISWKKRVILIVALVAILFTFFWKSRSNIENGYIFETVAPHNITEVVSESGNLTIAGMTEVFSPTNGIISEVYVTNGSLVGKDEDLFKVTSTATEDDRAAALATLAAKQAALKKAEQTKITLQSSLEAARKSILDAQEAVDNKNDALSNDPNVYSTNEADSIDSALTSARYTFNAAEKKYVEADIAIGSARAAVASAKLAYDSTKDRIIKSPTIGTVSNISLAVGNSVTANGGTGLVQALTIANFSSNQIVLEINETDIGKIQVGQTATIYPDALPNNEYMGIVRRLDDIGKDDEGVITYNVYLDIVNPESELKSGMTVDVDILTNELTEILSVPNAAIKPYQGGKSVRILNRDTQELENVPVTIGVKGEKYTQILDGIEEGTEIVVSLTNDKAERTGPLGF